MNARLEKIENSEAYLEFEIESSAVEKAMDEAYKKVVERVDVPGYEKGQAPREAVESEFGMEILLQEALELFVPEAYYAAIKELEIKTIGDPDIEVGHVVKGEPVNVRVCVPVFPEVKLGTVEGLEINIPSVRKVTDKEVDKRLEEMRRRNKIVIDKYYEPAEYGDTVTIDFEGTMEGQEFQGEKDFKVLIGSNTFIPGFEEKLIGAKKGYQLDINLNFDNNVLSGKHGSFKVLVKKVENIELRELDDAFAQEIGHVNSLKDLRSVTREKLKAEEIIRFEHYKQQAVLDAALEVCEITVPESIAMERTVLMMEDFKQKLAAEGGDIESYLKMTNTNKEALQAEMWKEAKRLMKIEYMLDKIIKEKTFDITDEELQQGAEAMAQNIGMKAENPQEALGPLMDKVIFDIKSDKAVQYLLDHAVITHNMPAKTNLINNRMH